MGSLLLLAGAASVVAAVGEEATEPATPDLTDVPLEQLLDVIVVTASRNEQRLHQAPASMSVFSAATIEQLAVDDYGDLLRHVPGLNVAQLSARDVQVTGRAATGSLATSELVLLDGRTVYLDFFGFVMWDLIPVNTSEIKQVEVVRGPGSAVWGANAMTGVIQVITKAPREMVGTSMVLGAGERGSRNASLTHAGIAGRLAYKLSGGWAEQDAYERPTGTIPGSSTTYPEFVNAGTEQPRIDLRLEHPGREESLWRVSAGAAGTNGLVHSGIGPFDVHRGSSLSYAKLDWSRRAMQASAYVNLLDGAAENLLSVGVDGRPIAFDFESQTYHLEFSDHRLLGKRHQLTYGGSLRRSDFALTIAPRGRRRTERGIFVQDSWTRGDRLRWLVGVRWDDIDPIGSALSPRMSLLFSPRPRHTLRLSYNRAFRAPSVIDNFLDTTFVNRAVLPPVPPLVTTPTPLTFPIRALGNPRLQEERLEAVELGYVGTAWQGRATLTCAFYRNETRGTTDFFALRFYDSTNPVPGWPLPAALLDSAPFAGLFPAAFTLRNVGTLVNEGAELGLELRPAEAWSMFANYSYQARPEARGIPSVALPDGSLRQPLNTPPRHRANAGAVYRGERLTISASANYSDRAFWTDILDARFWGPTDAYLQGNLSVTVELPGGRAALSLRGQNLTDERVQQHVFGDLIGRKITAEVHLRF